MALRCMIVDDEPASRDILEKYIREIPGLDLVGVCRDAFGASDALAGGHVDLIFLDINMPGLSGISFARSLETSPVIVFTTAYPEYAVEGFEINAADYLVKPFSRERFLKAVNRARERAEQKSGRPENTPSLLVRSDKKIYNLKLAELQIIEGCGDYIKLILEDLSLVVHETMKGFLAGLPEDAFMRIHKSFAVRIDAIDYIEGNRAFVSGRPVPISPELKKELLQQMGNG